MPIFLILIAGAIDLGRLFYAYVAITNASKEGALFGASHPLCATAASSDCLDPMNVTWRVQNEATNLKDAGGSPPGTSVACLDKVTRAPIGLSDCLAGDTYRVDVTYGFRLITPILGSVLEKAFTLRAESDATVFNAAFDPTPGVSVRKTVLDPKTNTYVRSPLPNPVTGNPTYLEFASSDWINYRVSVVNSGGTPLTTVGMQDSAFAKGWAPVSTDCPARPTALAIGASYTCAYRRRPGVPDGKPSIQATNTVTVTADQISQVQDLAVVTVVANPPELQIRKDVGLYRNAMPFGPAGSVTVARSAAQVATVWFRIRVRNVGGQSASGLQVVDSLLSLPFGSSGCPRLPSSLAANATYTCFYPTTFDLKDRVGSSRNTATARSDSAPTVSAKATVTLTSCQGGDLVVPNLVERPIGSVRSVDDARSAWLNAGFLITGFNSGPGSGSADVVSQSLAPFSCEPADADVTVRTR
jgi:Flp pilus assembly protein TadG